MAVKKKRKRGNPFPLVVESYPKNYNGYPFVTLIEHRNEHILTIVDNANEKVIKAFVLDLCGPENVNEQQVIATASQWFYTHKQRFPLSIEFARQGLTQTMSKILRSFVVDYVTRVIGILPRYDMETVQSTKRRRRKVIPANVEVKKRIIKLT